MIHWLEHDTNSFSTVDETTRATWGMEASGQPVISQSHLPLEYDNVPTVPERMCNRYRRDDETKYLLPNEVASMVKVRDFRDEVL